jgi:hypothetical protein
MERLAAVSEQHCGAAAADAEALGRWQMDQRAASPRPPNRRIYGVFDDLDLESAMDITPVGSSPGTHQVFPRRARMIGELEPKSGDGGN